MTFVAKVGDDDFGEAAIRSYEAEGIVTDHVSRASGVASGVAVILIDAHGENSIAVASGANSLLTPADIDAAADAIAAADMVLVQLEIPLPAVRRVVEIASGAGRPVILNPAPACQLDDDLFARLHLITPNESEAGLLTGLDVSNQDTAAAAASQFIARAPKPRSLRSAATAALCSTPPQLQSPATYQAGPSPPSTPWPPAMSLTEPSPSPSPKGKACPTPPASPPPPLPSPSPATRPKLRPHRSEIEALLIS